MDVSVYRNTTTKANIENEEQVLYSLMENWVCMHTNNRISWFWSPKQYNSVYGMDYRALTNVTSYRGKYKEIYESD